MARYCITLLLLSLVLCAAEAARRREHAAGALEAGAGVPLCGAEPTGDTPLLRLKDQIANARACLRTPGRHEIIPKPRARGEELDRQVLAAVRDVKKSDQSPSSLRASVPWTTGSTQMRSLLVTADLDMDEADDATRVRPLANDEPCARLSTRGPVARLDPDWGRAEFFNTQMGGCLDLVSPDTGLLHAWVTYSQRPTDYTIVAAQHNEPMHVVAGGQPNAWPLAPDPKSREVRGVARVSGYKDLMSLESKYTIQTGTVMHNGQAAKYAHLEGIWEEDTAHGIVTNVFFEDKRTPLFFEWHEVTATADRLKGRRQLLRNGQSYDSNGQRGFLYNQGELCSEFASANVPLARKVGDRCGSRMVGNKREPNDANCHCFALSLDDKLPLHQIVYDRSNGHRVQRLSRRVEVMRVLFTPGTQTTEFLRAIRDIVRPPGRFHESARKWLMANEHRLMIASVDDATHGIASAPEVLHAFLAARTEPVLPGQPARAFVAARTEPMRPPAGQQRQQPPQLYSRISLKIFDDLDAAATPETIQLVPLPAGEICSISLEPFHVGQRAVALMGRAQVQKFYAVESIRGLIRSNPDEVKNPGTRDLILVKDIRFVRFT